MGTPDPRRQQHDRYCADGLCFASVQLCFIFFRGCIYKEYLASNFLIYFLKESSLLQRIRRACIILYIYVNCNNIVIKFEDKIAL
jgi:hypothetical protein